MTADHPDTPVHESDAGETPTVWPADREGIRAAVKEALPAIRECYQGWLAMQNELAGKLSVRFVIAASSDGRSGTVSEAALMDSSVGQPFMEGCVLNIFSGLHFAAPENGRTEVRYPLVFQN